MDLKHIVTAIRHCGRVQALKHGKSFYSRLIKTGYSQDCSSVEDARNAFDEMPHINIVTWTTMVSAYTSSGKPRKAISLCIRMLDTKAEKPNGFMYSVVMKACGLVGDIGLGKVIRMRIYRENLSNDIVLMNTLLDSMLNAAAWMKQGKFLMGLFWLQILLHGIRSFQGIVRKAVRLFNRMPMPNAVSWNSIIAGFVDNRSSCALEFVCKMHHEGLKLDDSTFPCAFKSCSYVGFLAMGEQIHCYVISSGFSFSCFTMSALVDMYSNCNRLNEAIKLFDHHSNGSVSENFALIFLNFQWCFEGLH